MGRTQIWGGQLMQVRLNLNYPQTLVTGKVYVRGYREILIGRCPKFIVLAA